MMQHIIPPSGSRHLSLSRRLSPRRICRHRFMMPPPRQMVAVVISRNVLLVLVGTLGPRTDRCHRHQLITTEA